MKNNMDLSFVLPLYIILDVSNSQKTFNNGLFIYERKSVKDVLLWKTGDREHVEAEISGYHPQLWVQDNDGELGFSCGCGSDGPKACKHVVALLLYRYYKHDPSAYEHIGTMEEYQREIENDEDFSDYEGAEDDEEFGDFNKYGESAEAFLPDKQFYHDVSPRADDSADLPAHQSTNKEPPKPTNKPKDDKTPPYQGPPTDFRLMRLIDKALNQDIIKEATEEGVLLVPSLDVASQCAFLAVTIGKGKQYTVKNLEKLCYAVVHNEDISYGKEFSAVHSMEMFDEDSQRLMEFLFTTVSEESYRGTYNYSLHNRRYDSLDRDKKYTQLSPSAIDRFLATYLNQQIELRLEDQEKKQPYTVAEKNPRLTLSVRTDDRGTTYIRLQDTGFVFGAAHIYLPCPVGEKNADRNLLCRYDKDSSRKIRPLLKTLCYAGDVFLAPQDITSFYTSVLLECQDYIELTGNTKVFDDCTPEELEVVVYLDSPRKNLLTARVSFRYSSGEIDAVEDAHKAPERTISYYINEPPRVTYPHIKRDLKKEKYFFACITRYFKAYDSEGFFLHLDSSQDDSFYDFLTEGLPKLAEQARLMVTDRFQRIGAYRPLQLAVAVRMESELLQIDVKGLDFPQEELEEVLNSYRLKKKYHRFKDGSFLNLGNNALEELSDLAATLNLTQEDFIKQHIVVPRYRALYLDMLLKNSDRVTFERDGNFKRLVKDISSFSDNELTVPASLEKTMRSYQKDGFSWLAAMDTYGFGGILADDMGLGKTLQILALILRRKELGQPCHTLVVCPASLVFNWHNEVNKFTPSLTALCITGAAGERRQQLETSANYDICITSYDLLKRDIMLYENEAFDYEIIDEAQYIKNFGTQNAKAAKAVKSRQRFAVTGTPIENRLSELWSIFDYLMPGYLHSYKKFKENYELPIIRGHNEDDLRSLTRQVAPFILRRSKAKVLKELPEKVETVLYTRMEGEQKKLYQANLLRARQNAQAVLSAGEFETSKLEILAMLTRLRQLCCHPSLCHEDYTEGSAKMESCLELLREATDGGHKVLLFSQFTSLLALLTARLGVEGIPYYILTGATPKATRLELVDKFNEDSTPVFLISLKAGGTGLNLTGADIVVHFDPWWNVAAQNQATDRAHRIGQKHSVQVYKLIEKDSIEEKILKLQSDKKNLSDAIVGDDISGLGAISEEILLDILS